MCELCTTSGGIVLWESPTCRVVRVDDQDHPGFCRVIWTAHVREMTDLDPAQRLSLMNVVFTVERVLRTLFSPDKINLASFGNVTPHIHWHIIPRWRDDSHFPETIWGKPLRTNQPHCREVDDEHLRHVLQAELRALTH